MMATNRVQVVAAVGGAFFGGWLGEFGARLGTPVRTDLFSGVVSTAFLLGAVRLVDGSVGSVFARPALHPGAGRGPVSSPRGAEGR